MAKKLRSLALIALSAAMAVSVVGCGGGDTSSTASTGSTASSGGESTVNYPNGKTITSIVAWAAGSATDLNMRMLGQYMEQELGTTITVQNTAGGGGEIGWTALANASNDGYTIGMVNSPAFQLPIQRGEDCRFTVDSFIPIGNMVTDPGVVVVATDDSINSMADLVEEARNNPGQITVATTGLTTSEARACNTLAENEGVTFNIVPYDGAAEAINSIIGGHVRVGWLNIGDVMNHVNQGNVKALAVGSLERMAQYPDLPTFTEEGLEMNQFSMRTLAAPAGTDPEIVAILEEAMKNAMENPEFIEAAEAANVLLDWQDSATMTQVWKDLDTQWRAEWAERPWA